MPEQEIRDGIVRLRVVEAKLGRLEIEDHKYFRKKRLQYYWDIEKGEVLHYDKLYKSLQMMNKNPDRQVTSDLRASEEIERTDIHLNVDTHFPMHVSSAFDNEGSVTTGYDRSTMGLRHNNLLGLDDTFISGFTFGNDFESMYGYHRVPITSKGTTFMYGYSFSHSSPKKDFSVLKIISQSRTTSLFLYQDLYRGAKYSGELSFGMEAKDRWSKTLNVTTTWDRLRIFKLGGTFMINSFKGNTYIQSEISQGINGFGARRRNSLTSRGTGNIFTRLNLSVQDQRYLPLNLTLLTKLKAQAASVKLPSSEVFYLGGLDSVRGYPSGDFFSDSGIQANAELLVPAFFIPKNLKFPFDKNPFKDSLTGVIFFDYGFGKKRGGPHILNPTGNLKSVGVGLRTRFFDKATLRTEWGFVIGDASISEKGSSRFHLSFNFDY